MPLTLARVCVCSDLRVVQRVLASSAGSAANATIASIAGSSSGSTSTQQHTPLVAHSDAVGDHHEHDNEDGGEDDADASSLSTTATAILIAALASVVVVALVVAAGRVQRETQHSLPLTPALDATDATEGALPVYKRYCPTPVDATQHSRHAKHSRCASSVQQQTHESHWMSTPAATAAAARSTTVQSPASPTDDDTRSNSYRTCSRVFTERLSSESSWVWSSTRSNRVDSSEPLSGRQAPPLLLTTQQLARHQQQQQQQSIAFDTHATSATVETFAALARTNTRDSLGLFSTLLESERASEVSWSRSSSWSGSDVSSLDSARGSDGSLCARSSVRSSIESLAADDRESELDAIVTLSARGRVQLSVLPEH